MEMPAFLAADPEHIAISKSKGIQIDWKDGHHSSYDLQYLRNRCPCATCTEGQGHKPGNAQSASPFELYKPKLKMSAVEPVGNYAIRIEWNDGHNTGIYSYQYLRQICPCSKCIGNG
jgi:DUF971 family protein